jgi:hypothetical protein
MGGFTICWAADDELKARTYLEKIAIVFIIKGKYFIDSKFCQPVCEKICNVWCSYGGQVWASMGLNLEGRGVKSWSLRNQDFETFIIRRK